jgi:hypothetical protein
LNRVIFRSQLHDLFQIAWQPQEADMFLIHATVRDKSNRISFSYRIDICHSICHNLDKAWKAPVLLRLFNRSQLEITGDAQSGILQAFIIQSSKN